MIFPFTKKKDINDLLENIAISLDLTGSQYQAVVERYSAVANHLAKDGSILSSYQPDIKPQGSFLLGTMIRPLMEDDELDVDLVCRLKGKDSTWAQVHLKEKVGEQLKQNETYERMLDEEGNRCWTLLYAETTRFHMDILPAILGSGHFELLSKSFSSLNQSQVQQLAIRITDKRLPNYRIDTETENWLKSNPFGYAAWFKDRANTSILKSFTIRESVEPLPKHNKDKYPLQRVVQLLKRHRDIMFGGDDYKPISIIITTLAARAYNKETNLIVALNSVLQNMERFIDSKYNHEFGKTIKWITNPVNEEENFADRWILEPEREKRFYDWLEKAKADFSYLKTCDLTQAYRYLKELIGTKAVNEAVREIEMENLIDEAYKPLNYKPELLTVSHREQPTWPLNLNKKVEVHGHYKEKNGKHITITSNAKIPKSCDIFFVASTNVAKPFDVYWQVVNTGAEAANDQGLRGGIFHSKTLGKGGLNQKEISRYKGLHWVECFIVKNNICVARSSEFFVNIE